MPNIRAVFADPKSKERLVIRDTAAPVPTRNEAIVAVKAISLNLGEVRRSLTADVEWRPGWDLAGIVEQPASDNSGPKSGARVVGFLPFGAWAEKAAVPANSIAALPDNVSFAQASTLPVAGLTALYSLERGGFLLGRKVLITGASGGVGHLAIQIARDAGAYVIAVVRSDRRSAMVKKAGAHEVVISEDLSQARAFAPYELILESVGGRALGAALSMLAVGGTCVLLGVSESAEVTFNARTFFATGGAGLYGLILFHEVVAKPASTGLERLCAMVSSGRLVPHIDCEAPWTQIADVARRLYDRKIPGKAVLLI
jgi:NADPH2:quinone reductase